MRPLYTRLLEARQRLGFRWDVLERDYLLSWILAGISHVPALRQTLVFKGGTALRKCYFGDYRFSEDLDFSTLGDDLKGEAVEQLVQEACIAAVELLEEYAPVEISCERYTEAEPHPRGQEAFVIRARFPWQRIPQTRVMVEVTMDEPIFWQVENRGFIHAYEENLEAEMQVYALEEVVAEKLRAILQHAAALRRRGWSRSRGRDYYDLWRVLGAYKNQLDLIGFDSLLHEKCAVREVGFKDEEDFFDDMILANVASTWDQSLGLLVTGLPPFQTVIEELRPQVASLVRSW